MKQNTSIPEKEDPREDHRTQDTWENPITEHPEKDPLAGGPEGYQVRKYSTSCKPTWKIPVNF